VSACLAQIGTFAARHRPGRNGSISGAADGPRTYNLDRIYPISVLVFTGYILPVFDAFRMVWSLSRTTYPPTSTHQKCFAAIEQQTIVNVS